MSDTIDTILTQMGQDSARIAENVPKVFEAGQKSEYDRFWDAYQDNGERTNYEYAFGGAGWTQDLFNPKYSFLKVRSPYMMFMSSKIETIPAIEFDSRATYSDIFKNATLLKTIEKLTFSDIIGATFNRVFQSCTSLENLTIGGEIAQNGFDVSWSTKLTHDSLMSIINALADKSEDTSGTIWTVTLGETNIAKLTDEEINIATQKGWVLG